MRHTETRIYRSSLELVGLCREVLDSLPPGFAFLADQLRRASSSVLLNFAEGCGKQTRRDRKKYFAIAKGSAYEIAAILDFGHVFAIVSGDVRARGERLCDCVAAMVHRYH